MLNEQAPTPADASNIFQMDVFFTPKAHQILDLTAFQTYPNFDKKKYIVKKNENKRIYMKH